MVFKVFDSAKVPEPEVFFKLEECFETIQLVACDAKGIKIRNGCILSIQKDGYLRTFEDINKSLGLKLDSVGRIMIDND